ncbi:hypothetical protein Ancab_037313 [Ancistrocladus abbreviatus]
MLFFGSMSLLVKFIAVNAATTTAIAPSGSTGNISDYLALLAFKSKIVDDPQGILRLRNDSSHVCEWEGITCGNRRGRVTILDLSSKGLVGTLSPSLGNLSFIRQIMLLNNTFQGQIPSQIGRLHRLQVLDLRNNSMEGNIPANLSRCFNPRNLSFGVNKVTGKIPAEFGSFSMLRVLAINDNSLTGSIQTIGNMTSLVVAYAPVNYFDGDIPDSIGELKGLNFLYLGANNLSGKIPPAIYNLSSLTKLSLTDNQLQGTLPHDLGLNLPNLRRIIFDGRRLTHLEKLSFSDNHLGMDEASDLSFVDSLVNCSSLIQLAVGGNDNLGGVLPRSLVNLSAALIFLDFSNNLIVGDIPMGLGKLINMRYLLLSNNQLTGTVPSDVRELKQLQWLALGSNRISGTIPSLWGSLPMLSVLHLGQNGLGGSIPPDLGNCQNLIDLDLSLNDLTGLIPAQLLDASPLSIGLNLSWNNLIGPFPAEVGNVKQMTVLDVSNNGLNGEIPSTLGSCTSLVQLRMEGNLFHGPIPPSLSALKGIEYIDFSRNNLTGTIPEYLADLRLTYLNLSFNNFEESHKWVLNEQSDWCWAVGSFGSVYTGILDPEGITIAVKVFNPARQGAFKSYVAECEAWRNIRHRNLVKIITTCSSNDFQGNEFKALVYEFMPNGCLETWLHPDPEVIKFHNLSLLQRIDIAIDVATAVDYLHHGCQIPIIHCDLKPSNVLLDANTTAHVGDFGLAKFRQFTDSDQISSFGVRGTIGYTPPEYGMGSRVSAEGDVYSYGILLLEMITGKRPTDQMFSEELSLHEFAKTALSYHYQVVDIVDPRILIDEEKGEGNTRFVGRNSVLSERLKECLMSMLKIGGACSLETPHGRMSIRDVIHELQLIKASFLAHLGSAC